MVEMPRHFQGIPIRAENPSSRRIDVGHHRVENPARLQPFVNPCQHLLRLVQMLEDVEASNGVKTLGRKGRLKNISHKDPDAISSLHLPRYPLGHFDPK